MLDKVNISINAGKITALIGPNGAGKSSAFRILAGLVKPEQGEVQIDGIQKNSFEELRQHCGYMLESPDFYPYLSGKKNLELLIQISGSKVQADELLELVGLSKESNKKVQNYSKGMKQRLGFAQVLIDDPDFLILDEPFNGLDPEVKEQMLEHLGLLKKRGKGILISTHLLEDIEFIADDFVLLNKGQVFLKGNMTDSHTEKQNVTLFFSKPIPEIAALMPELTVLSDKLKLMATIKETEELLKELYRLDIVPYRITRSSILHDKYMEIANETDFTD
ncbi:MAG TPA: ABC transporter ATP-binding protein [Draconibacterium sp.]|nr:ABC transporter ATP-binding protein [Draconibacterium sp.]